MRAFVLLAIILTLGCTSGPAPVDTRSYEQQMVAFRGQKDAMFRSAAPGTESPIPVADRAAFAGLAYYPIDPTYHVPAHLTEDRTGPPVIIELSTSTGPRRKMRRVGKLGFALNGQPLTLTAFADADVATINRLFVPFADLTSLTETYRGGRYLDLDRTPTGLYDLDFNRAYHPYCVYNPTYECPVPPHENRLTVAIRAGEKLDAR